MKSAIGRTTTRVIILILLLHSPVASAAQQLQILAEQQTSHGESHLFFPYLIAHAKELGLTADQLANVRALHLDFDLTRVKAEADIMLTEREITALFNDDTSQANEVEAKIRQSEAMRAELRVASFKAIRKALSLLTPEQREKSRRLVAADRTKLDVSLATPHF